MAHSNEESEPDDDGDKAVDALTLLDWGILLVELIHDAEERTADGRVGVAECGASSSEGGSISMSKPLDAGVLTAGSPADGPPAVYRKSRGRTAERVR